MSPSQQDSCNFVVGTSGHIDHGKTALIKALTGVDADRFEEEKQRGITIDLGFAPYQDESGTQLAFVDVPGHEKFVHNMLAGVAGFDAVLLVIAADEGIMPHLSRVIFASFSEKHRGASVQPVPGLSQFSTLSLDRKSQIQGISSSVGCNMLAA